MNNRLLKIRTLIKKQDLDALLISSSSTLTYLTNYSGFSTEEREAFLLVTKHNQYVITDGRYSEAVIEKIPHFQLIEISSNRSLQNILKNLAQTEKVKQLGIEEKNITYFEYKQLTKHFDNIYHYSDIINSLLVIKEPEEIVAIEKACKLGDKAFKFILTKIKKGVSEKELAFELELFIKKKGADISFKPIVAFGKNSSIPHHQTGNEQLTMNNVILLDFGVKLNNYCSDMTRTIFFGSANAEFKKMYQTVLDAQKLAIEQLTNETMASRIDKIAREYIISQNYPTIPHSLGHGIGIEVHEAPRLSPTSKDIFKPGMVFSIEPGIYLRGVGGMRIEDLVVLEKKSPRLLTHAKRELIEL